MIIRSTNAQKEFISHFLAIVFLRSMCKNKKPEVFEASGFAPNKMAVVIRYEIGMVKYRSGKWRSPRLFQRYGGILDSNDILLY